MNEFITIDCPYCGVDFAVASELADGTTEFIVDCENCCRPLTVRIRVSAGEVQDWQVSTG